MVCPTNEVGKWHNTTRADLPSWIDIDNQFCFLAWVRIKHSASRTFHGGATPQRVEGEAAKSLCSSLVSHRDARNSS